MAVWSLFRFRILTNYKIDVSFADGTTGVADLGPRLSQGPLGDDSTRYAMRHIRQRHTWSMAR